METAAREEFKRAANVHLFHPFLSICTDRCCGHAPACVMWDSHDAPEVLCPTCISTPVAGKRPIHRQEFPGKGYFCQHSSTGIEASGMPSENHQVDSKEQKNISAMGIVSDRVQ